MKGFDISEDSVVVFAISAYPRLRLDKLLGV